MFFHSTLDNFIFLIVLIHGYNIWRLYLSWRIDACTKHICVFSSSPTYSFLPCSFRILVPSHLLNLYFASVFFSDFFVLFLSTFSTYCFPSHLKICLHIIIYSLFCSLFSCVLIFSYNGNYAMFKLMYLILLNIMILICFNISTKALVFLS